MFGLAAASEVDPELVARAARTPTPTLIAFPHQSVPSLAPLRADADPVARRTALVAALRVRADREQAGVRQWLGEHGIAYRAYWISNVIAADLAAADIAALAARDDVAAIVGDAAVALSVPTPELARSAPAAATAAPPWGVTTVRAPAVWAQGITGQGVVVAGEDTGYQWDHPALKAHYRGWNGSAAQHAYNWHDAIHVTGSSCGANAAAPCDDDSHGTHTMGTMVGDNGVDPPIGVAPGAHWIGCRNMNAGAGTPASYIECMQWMLAPTDSAGLNPRPDLAPDIVNNSWGCPASEGCTAGTELEPAVDNLVAGGIFYVASAGNDGSVCQSIHDAPATYAASFVVGATDSGDKIVSFSSRGPVSSVSRPLPDLVAPGYHVYSSLPGGNYGYLSGTSMAGPHVAGVAALMLAVNPALRGHPDQIADILRASAVRTGLVDQWNTSCGGLSLTDWPNNQAGWGRLDALAAVELADTIFADGYDH